MGTDTRMRAVHIFSDRKFIPWVANTFRRQGWTATYIVIDPSAAAIKVSETGDIITVPRDQSGIDRIMDALQHADLAFHYFLDNFKAEIIANSPLPVRHFWCFYGAEVYQQTPLFRDYLYGPETRKLLRLLPEIRFRYLLRKWYYQWVRREPTPLQSLQRAMPRLSAMLWYVEDEITWIRQRLPLPHYAFFQFFRFEDIIPDEGATCDRSSRKVLVGNSATVENNHMDVLALLGTLAPRDISYTFPMSYGQFGRYKKILQSRCRRILGDKALLMDRHLPLAEYYGLLHEHPTAIFLHHRQQALGNIFYLLFAGAKVYLSDKNIIYTWLLQKGVQVYSFERQFGQDYDNHQLTLTDAEVVANKQAIRTLLRHDRNEAFFTWAESLTETNG